jgi:hypothetical protein
VRRRPSGNDDNGSDTVDHNDDDSVIRIAGDDTTATANNVRNDTPHLRGDVCDIRARSRPDQAPSEEEKAYATFLVATSTLRQRRRRATC